MRTWPGFTCPASMKARACSSSKTTAAGISLATMRQKMQLLISFSSSLVAAAWYLVKRAVFQPQRAQLPAPHTAAIERGEPRPQLQPQCRPMPANERRLLLRPQIEPGAKSLGRLGPFGMEVHFSLRLVKAHSRHRIDDDEQATPFLEVVAPLVRLSAVHVGEAVMI